MAAMNIPVADKTFEADAAAIAERIGAPEKDVRHVLDHFEAVQTMMQERHLSMDMAIFVLVANAQAYRRKDAIVTVPNV